MSAGEPSAAAPRGPRGHLPALDGLRGVALLLVLGHAFDLVPRTGAVPRALALGLDVGWIGVQLFFVLSGFLITGLLLDALGRPRYLRDFFVRRTLRIFPLYYAVLLGAFVVLPRLVATPPSHGAHQVWLWTYLSNFAAPLGLDEPSFPHVWSLAVEEQFYLAWPLIVALLGARRGGRPLAWLCGALVALAVVARVVVRARLGPAAAYAFTPCRMDALALGALACLAWRAPGRAGDLARRPGLVAAGLALVGGALLAGGLARTGAVMQVAGYGVIAAGCALLLLGVLADGAAARLLQFAPLRVIGRYSYGMYVFHALLHAHVGLPLLERLGCSASPTTAVALAYAAGATLATFAAAAASFHLLESPLLALKDRLAPRPAP